MPATIFGCYSSITGQKDLEKEETCITRKEDIEDNFVMKTEEIDDMEDDIANLSIQFENSMVITDGASEEKEISMNYIQKPKAAKKIDIKRLKDNVHAIMNSGTKSLSQIFKTLPNIYNSKECKEISMTFCLISLLHLANEKGFLLKKVGEDILTEC